MANLPEKFEQIELNYKGFPLTSLFDNGHRYLPVRTVCEIIDVKFSTQDRWLRSNEFYAQLYTPRGTVGADNKERTMNCLSFFDAFGWLNSITQKGRKEGSVEKQYAFMAWLREELLGIYKDVEQIKFENEREVKLSEMLTEKDERIAQMKSDLKKEESDRKTIAKQLDEVRVNKYNGQIEMF